MFPYIIVAILFIVLNCFTSNKNKIHKAFLLLFILALLACFRADTVGTDTKNYLLTITRTTLSESSWNYVSEAEPGYNVILGICNFLGIAPRVVLGFFNLIYLIGIFKFSKSRKCSVLLFAGLSLLLCHYLQSLNAVRQYFAIGLLLIYLSINKLQNYWGQVKLMGAILLIGYLFHNSIWVLLIYPLYNIVNDKFDIDRKEKSLKKIYVIALVGTFILFYIDAFALIAETLQTLYMINDKATAYFQGAAEKVETREVYSMVRMILDNSFVGYLLFVSRKVNVYTFLFVFGQICVNLFAPINPIFTRLSVGLFVLGLPYVIDCYYKSKNIRLTRMIILGYSLIFFCNYLIKGYGQIVPYSLFF